MKNFGTSQDVTKYTLLKTSWKYQAKELCRNSTLHGVNYIAQKEIPFHEKFMWFSFILTGLSATIVIIGALWDKFQTSPTITGLDTDFHNWDVPFPAITLCGTNMIDKEKLSHYVTNYWGNDTVEEQVIYYKKYITQVANLSYDNLDMISYYTDDKSLPQTNLKDILFKVVIRCEELLLDCVWKGEPYNCCEGFYPTLTDHGFCYTFNSKHFEKDKIQETGENTKLPFEIKHIYETDNDLFLSISTEENIQKNPIGIYIHSNNEKVGQDLPPHHMWNQRISKIFFTPKDTYTTEDAKQLSIKQRHCVFPDEITLITDNIYTYGACMSQCRMNIAKNKCGCIPFFYKEIEDYKHCDLNGLSCLAKHKDFISSGLSCECELGCMNTVYEIEKLEDAKTDRNTLDISFVSWPMIRYKRDVLFGWVDLFVAFGGIAGLFLGFSLLSGFETIYYFTLRACCMVYQDKEELVALHKEYENIPEPEINLDLKPTFMKPKESNQLRKRSKSEVFTIPYLP